MLTRWTYSIQFYFTEVEATPYIFTVETVTFNLAALSTLSCIHIYIYISSYIEIYVIILIFMRINTTMFLLFPLHLHWYDGIKRGIASLMVAVVVVVVLTLVAVHVPLLMYTDESTLLGFKIIKGF